MATTLPAGEALPIASLVTPTSRGVASRVIARSAGGNITVFAFDEGEEISEHSAPFDALVLTQEGTLALTVGGREVTATPGTVVMLPANVPHALRATTPVRMLLIMLRDTVAG